MYNKHIARLSTLWRMRRWGNGLLHMQHVRARAYRMFYVAHMYVYVYVVRSHDAVCSMQSRAIRSNYRFVIGLFG